MSKVFVVVVLALTLVGEIYRVHLISKAVPTDEEARDYRSVVLAGNLIEMAATLLAIVVTVVSL